MIEELKMLLELFGLFVMLGVTIYVAILQAFHYIVAHSSFVIQRPRDDGQQPRG